VTNASENTTFDLNGFSQTLAGLRRSSTAVSQVSTVTNSSTTPSTLTLNQSSTQTFSGRITGALTLAKAGNGTLTLSRSDALASSVSVMIDAGAISVSSSHTITALRLNGSWMPAGTYTSANSSGRIAGTGSLVVTTNGPIGFATWIDGFTSLTTEQKQASADPDADGISNQLEYILNGHPAQTNRAILPSITRTTTDLVFTFTQREESHTTTTQVFQSSSDLSQWTSLNITAPTAAEVSFGPSTNGARTVTIRIPLSRAQNGRLFGRLVAP
jgi:hypothetical protein